MCIHRLHTVVGQAVDSHDDDQLPQLQKRGSTNLVDASSQDEFEEVKLEIADLTASVKANCLVTCLQGLCPTEAVLVSLAHEVYQNAKQEALDEHLKPVHVFLTSRILIRLSDCNDQKRTMVLQIVLVMNLFSLLVLHAPTRMLTTSCRRSRTSHRVC